jgi:hypothetical protein
MDIVEKELRNKVKKQRTVVKDRQSWLNGEIKELRRAEQVLESYLKKINGD